MIRALGLSICLALGVALAAPALAQPREKTIEEHAEDAARAAGAALESLFRAVEGAISNLPQYQAPRLSPEGDIVIPRAPQRPQRDPTPLPRPQPAPERGPTGPETEEI